MKSSISLALGDVYIEDKIEKEFENDPILEGKIKEVIQKHSEGDWGHIPDEEKIDNDQRALSGGQIISAYEVGDEEIIVVTSADRKKTLVGTIDKMIEWIEGSQGNH